MASYPNCLAVRTAWGGTGRGQSLCTALDLAGPPAQGTIAGGECQGQRSELHGREGHGGAENTTDRGRGVCGQLWVEWGSTRQRDMFKRRDSAMKKVDNK